MINGIIFDFNGTLYLDDDINYITWGETVNRISEGKLDFDGFYRRLSGIPNAQFIKEVMEACGKECNDELIDRWSKEKEIAYRRYCLDHKRNKLNNGAEELLDYLKNKGYRLNICTASPIENVEFYFRNVKLDRWFDISLVSYDDGKSANKKEMYLKCADSISEKMENLLVFEDSPGSIRYAIEAGCKNVVAIRKANTPQYPEIKQIINNFTEFDRNLLKL